MLAAICNAFAAEIKRSLRALTLKAALVLTAVAFLLTAAGFALALLTVWLQALYGTMAALAIVAGGCAVLALVLLLIAFRKPLRPGSRPEQPAAATGMPPSDLDIARETIAASQRTIDESVEALQQGSRESMLAALALAVLTGLTLGKKL